MNEEIWKKRLKLLDMEIIQDTCMVALPFLFILGGLNILRTIEQLPKLFHGDYQALGTFVIATIELAVGYELRLAGNRVVNDLSELSS